MEHFTTKYSGVDPDQELFEFSRVSGEKNLCLIYNLLKRMVIFCCSVSALRHFGDFRTVVTWCTIMLTLDLDKHKILLICSDPAFVRVVTLLVETLYPQQNLEVVEDYQRLFASELVPERQPWLVMVDMISAAHTLQDGIRPSSLPGDWLALRCGSETVQDSLYLIELGYVGALGRSKTIEQLLLAIKGLKRGLVCYPDAHLAAALRKHHLQLKQKNTQAKLVQNVRLTRKERQVLSMMLQGMSNKQISEINFVSINTVKTHVANILAKTKVHSRSELLSKMLHSPGQSETINIIEES